MAGTCKENGSGSNATKGDGRRKGRPRLRWMDDVIADSKVLKIKLWMQNAKGEQCRPIVEQAKAHPGL
jgi:hypothetical protein